ncbi:fec operon regulator FecR [compost metagenome]|uniref:FecR family protein n=1 Tax=Pedobacter sp. ok626 TaxID=1761882 RepID=UPI000890C189|nr:FecR domain-containing protein [Pedobacter sp. ok626]SDK66324.1 FecR family protein [Pedobacter sp. ok626]
MNNLKATDYSSYGTLDFFDDENFIRYVLHPEEASKTHWQNVLSEYPDKAQAMEEAEGWILMLRAQKVYTPKNSAEPTWEQISKRIARHEHIAHTYKLPLKRVGRWASAIAAMMVIYFTVGELMQQGKQVIQSGYGQLRSITLPDASVATLNGNSRIHYIRDWRSDRPREIWLEGEASFAVKHVALKNRFQEADSFKVHVNGIELTVLGTKFNIKDRRGQTEIALLEGSLRIEKKGLSPFSRIMKPGDVFVYDGTQIQKEAQKIAAASQSWTKKELNVEGYTLKDIAEILEDTYGYKVTLHVDDLTGKRLSGTVPSGSAEDILFVVEKVFNVKIIKDKNQLLITH